MVRPIQYEEYDKLSDDVLYLGSNLCLRMNVSLSFKNQDQRHHFHKEYKYDSNHGDLRSIKRSFSYYLTLEKTDLRNINGGIMIRPQDMIILRSKLDEVSLWFKSDTFGLKDKKELIVKKTKQSIMVNGLANQKYLQFDPIVLVYENTGEQTPGVRITLGDSSIFADISVDKFFALQYTISEFNMYLSAQLLVNYLGRPEYGTNLYTIQDDASLAQPQDKMVGAKLNREIPKKNKSFFDNMNDLMNN